MLTSTFISLALTTALQAPVVISTATTTIQAPTPAPTPAYTPAPAGPASAPAPVEAPPVATPPYAVQPTPAPPQAVPYVPYTPPYATTPYPTPPPVDPAPYQAPPKRKSRFAFALLPTLTFAKDSDLLSQAALSFFFGGKLGDQWALGYQFTASPVFMYLEGMATRHYLTAMGHLGDRGFLSMGGGLALALYYPVALEGEMRLGVRFGPKRRGVFGGQFRLAYEAYSERGFPVRPQVGLFLGVSLF